jgi:hypothetical protein
MFREGAVLGGGVPIVSPDLVPAFQNFGALLSEIRLGCKQIPGFDRQRQLAELGSITLLSRLRVVEGQRESGWKA